MRRIILYRIIIHYSLLLFNTESLSKAGKDKFEDALISIVKGEVK
ncbi:MAG: hypothetical protein PUE24_03185 [Clostridiales bacterium]|nr:hypothetical protein [Clostridiales bacterium]